MSNSEIDDVWSQKPENGPKNPFRKEVGDGYAIKVLEQLHSTMKTQITENLEVENLQLSDGEFNADSLNNCPHNKNLPIYRHRENIIDAINKNMVCIIGGDTGCGKTTQVPQYILDSCIARNKDCNILISQPRKIAAITLAQRVAEERGVQIGEEVGFQVGLNRSCATLENITKILFCTFGVVLNKLTTFKSIARYSHIIIDEVHERDLDSDFLLAVIRRLMSAAIHTKIILMSATINHQDFVKFFRIPGYLEPAVIDCRGDRVHPIDILYIDNYEQRLANSEYLIDRSMMNYEDIFIHPKLYTHVCYIVFAMIEHMMKKKNTEEHNATYLIFLPGLVEIEAMYEKIKAYKEEWNEKMHFTEGYGKNLIQTVVLHSAVCPESQQKAFEMSAGFKIILSTNIAESGVTLPNVKMIFDFCLTRYLQKDKSTNLTTLVTDWASLQNLEQRAGRCGRTEKGVVYRIVYKDFFNKTIKPKVFLPEIQRIGLEDIVLKTKVLDLGSPADILALTMNPPCISAIVQSVLRLQEFGALKRFDNDQNSKINYQDGELTFLGRIMEALPIDCQLSRLVLFGYMLGVYDDALIVAAGLSLKSIFSFSFGSQLKAYGKKLAWADASECDCMAILNAYTKWTTMKSERRNVDISSKWCKNNCLVMRNLYEMEKLIEEIRKRMEEIGFKNLEKTWKGFSASDKQLLFKVCIAGAFGAPNFFAMENFRNSNEAFKIIDGLDAFRTVYFQGMNRDTLGKIYEDQIRETLLSENVIFTKENVHVKFSGEKMFVTFKENELDLSKRRGCSADDIDEMNKDFGSIPLEVYKAVKLRTLKKFPIYLLNNAAEKEKALQLGVATLDPDDGSFRMKSEYIENPEKVFLPTYSTHKMNGYIKSVGDTGRMFFKPVLGINFDKTKEERYTIFAKEMDELLNELDLTSNVAKKLKEKDFVIYEGDEGRLRGEIIGTNPCVMHCLDTGENLFPDFSRIRHITNEVEKDFVFNIPPQCFEISLLDIRPSISASKNRRWSREAVKFLREHIDHRAVIHVYSIVNNVVSVELFAKTKCINDELKSKGLAVECEESCLSKLNHQTRMNLGRYAGRTLPEDDFAKQTVDRIVSDSPNKSTCTRYHFLKGPYSTLESKVRGLSSGYANIDTNIQNFSVNQILLNDDIFDNHKKYFVAADVSLSMGGKIKLSEVSSIPPIPGLAAILAAVFSPCVEFHRNESKTKYTSLLCGLGFDYSVGHPFLADHDVAIELDVDLSPEHLTEINEIRQLISLFLHTEGVEKFPQYQDALMGEIMQIIREKFIELIKAKKTPMRNELPFQRYIWNIDQKEVWRTETDYERDLLEQINKPMISWKKNESNTDLENHAIELDQASKDCFLKRPEWKDQTCRFCDFQWDDIESLRLHVKTDRHIKKVAKYLNPC